MDAPARPDGPPVKDGKPYSRIAHLAEDVRPFVAVAHALRAAGLSAPEVLAQNLDAGLLLLEDLGGEGILVRGEPDRERLRAATLLLADLHAVPRAQTIPGAGGGNYTLPAYDREALAIEVALLPDWYFPHRGLALSPEERAEFDGIWSGLFQHIDSAEKSWVLRDYHSPNLLWLPDREGRRRLGVLDFQDAVFGPAAYDVASLLQDARVTVPAPLEAEMLEAYIAARAATPPDFDREAFAEAYAILAAQRATKILGIFARLAHRDGKPGYLRHIPRLHDYLARSLKHPVLSRLHLWYEGHLSFSS